jgi:hypothetical protein
MIKEVDTGMDSETVQRYGKHQRSGIETLQFSEDRFGVATRSCRQPG